MRELCRKAEASQEQAQTVARYFEKLHFICLFILHCVALYRFLYCIVRRYTAFYTALVRRYIALYSLTARYTVYCIVRRHTALYCIGAALYRFILHWCGAIPLYTALVRRYTYTALVRRYTAMVSLVSSSSVTLLRVDTTSPVLLSLSAAQ